MSKKYLGLVILLLVLTVLISGCGKKATSQNDQNQNQVNNPVEDTVNLTGEYTINELLTTNKPLKCYWKESVTNSSEVTNIMYINGQKFYQDVAMGDLGHAYTISDGEYFYMWNDFTNVASKMNIKEAEKISEPTSAQTSGNNAGLEQKKNFICEKWSVDNAMFILPADKDFKDLTEQMGQAVQDLQKNSATYNQQACDMCAKAPTEELRNSCLKSAQCQ